MFKTLVTTLAACFLTSIAHSAEWEGVFEGTIGKAAILVELNAGQDKSDYKGAYVEGSRYSYVPKAYDLKLVLDAEGKTLKFTESTVPFYAAKDLPKTDPAFSGHWSLEVDGQTATGTWTSRDGKKTLPIQLKRQALLNNVGADFNRLSETYNHLWFKHVTIAGATKPVQFGSATLAFERDSIFKLDMPVFTALPDKAQMAKANALLRQYYKRSLVANRDCVNGLNSEKDVPPAAEYAFKVVYATPRVVTISEGGSVFCGGAHPNNYVNYLTFDVAKGRQIGGQYQVDLSPQGFGDVLKLANATQRKAFENFALGYWQKVAKAAGAKEEEFCEGPGFMEEQAPGEKEFGLSFDPKGLAVQRTDYPSAAAICLFQDYNPAVIPWTDLKPWLNPAQTLLTTELK
jgi:hypothetical protein